MEEDKEKKFVCKICSKRCFSGYSLGGHMRGHLATIAAKKDEDHNETHMGLECSDDIDNSYGLRENPKKTWRNSDAKHECKECGKEFQSVRALSGHMRCHSKKEKERVCNQCGKGFGSMKALFGHMRHHTKRSPESQSEYENLCPIRRKRSKLKYKVAGYLSLSNSNASSSGVSEIDELEEAAASLIMLSRGVTNFVLFNSVFESSENNNSEMCKANCRGGKLIGDAADDSWTKKKKKMRENNESELGEGSGFLIRYKKKAKLGLSEFGELDSGFFINNEKKAELGVSIDGSQRSDEFKKSELDEESGIELFDAEIGNGNDPTEVELVTDWVTEVGLLDQDDSEMVKSNSSKGATFDDQDLELGGNLCDKMNKSADSVSEIFDNSVKKRAYKCRTCNRIFRSHRALGGHRSGHKTTSCALVVKIGSQEKSVDSTLMLNDTDSNSNLEKLDCNENLVEEPGYCELKKSKDHECPICFKIFPSGQALGGHKRAHYIGFSENTNKEIVLAKEEVSDLHVVCDLNVPVSLEMEVDAGVGFKPWWVGTDHERGSLMISN